MYLCRPKSTAMRLTKDYFLGDDVLGIARDLLGKYLFTRVDGQLTGGILCEVEAYTTDRASHAFGGRRTRRNEMMYHEGGIAYVYLCYGMHHLLNFVTNVDGVPDAVLIRGIIPTHGEELMLLRTRKHKITPDIGIGPGKVSKLLGLTVSDNGLTLCGDTLWIEDRGLQLSDRQIKTTPRIGVDYAGDDALLPYRFVADPMR